MRGPALIINKEDTNQIGKHPPGSSMENRGPAGRTEQVRTSWWGQGLDGEALCVSGGVLGVVLNVPWTEGEG